MKLKTLIISLTVNIAGANNAIGLSTMKMKASITPILMSLMLYMPLGHASDSMRCGTRLVQEGFSVDKVKRLCGKADGVYPLADKIFYRTLHDGVQEATIAEVIRVEMWVYRGSDNQFVRNLYFENGHLTKIELDGH